MKSFKKLIYEWQVTKLLRLQEDTNMTRSAGNKGFCPDMKYPKSRGDIYLCNIMEKDLLY